jgi:hypothetical protein
VAAGLLQARPDLVGMAGFDSEIGPDMGQAIKEAGTLLEGEESGPDWIRTSDLLVPKRVA